MKVKEVLDVKGLACPMPIVRTKKAMEQLEVGQILQVVTTDQGSKSDLTAWSKSQGHQLLDIREERNETIFLIKKG